MQKIQREDLLSLEQYSKQRNDIRAKVMAHKQNRKVFLGENITLYFEDRQTMQYQIQEMLRAERIFEDEGIMDELNAYNPLIPDGSNLKATMMIEYGDVEERRDALAKLVGVEDKIWLRVSGFDKVYPVADEDLERDTAEKTSSVHFLRFEFSNDMIAALKSGAQISAGVDHSAYQCAIDALPATTRGSLLADFA